MSAFPINHELLKSGALSRIHPSVYSKCTVNECMALRYLTFVWINELKRTWKQKQLWLLSLLLPHL